VLIGSRDEWCPVVKREFLEKNRTFKSRNPAHDFSLKVYPNATHAFDFEGLKQDLNGHHEECDPEAAADAISLARAFLAKYFGGKRESLRNCFFLSKQVTAPEG
jgi:dienelactone hydrolase